MQNAKRILCWARSQLPVDGVRFFPALMQPQSIRKSPKQDVVTGVRRGPPNDVIDLSIFDTDANVVFKQKRQIWKFLQTSFDFGYRLARST